MEINTKKAGIARSKEENRSLSKDLQTKAAHSTSTAKPDLKEGQQLKGIVLDLRYDEVKLQLEPGKQIVTARLSGEVPLAIGDEAKFQVTEDSSSRLLLKYLPEDTAPTASTILKALTASGLPLTDRNKEILSELLKYRMPIDKQTLQTLIKAAVSNRNASPQSLVLMQKNHIPLTPSNIRQFEAYQNGTSKLITDIGNITRSLSELLIPADKAETDIAGPLTSDALIPLASSSIPEQVFTQPPEQAVGQRPSQAALKTAANSSLHQPSVWNTISEDNIQASDNQYATVFALNEALLRILLTDQEALFQTAPKSPDATAAQMLYTITTLSDSFTATEQANLKQLIRQLPEGSVFVESLSEGTSVTDILKFISGQFTKTGEEAAKALLQSPEYAKLLSEAFHQRWTITPEKLEQKDSVTELYRKLQEDMEAFSLLGKSEEKLLESFKLQEPVKNLQENLLFLKDLNQIFTYLQLPLQLEDQDIHSELYVFTNKRALKDKKDLSVLLHLDMPNLGALNIHVTLEHNIVHATIYPEEKAAKIVLTDHISSLREALRKKGYTFSYEVMDVYQKPDFVKDFIEQNTEESSPLRYSFDIRA